MFEKGKKGQQGDLANTRHLAEPPRSGASWLAVAGAAGAAPTLLQK